MLLVQLATMNVCISFLSAAQFVLIQFLGINSSIHKNEEFVKKPVVIEKLES